MSGTGTPTDLMTPPWRGPVGDPDPVVADGLRLADLSRRRRGGLKGPEALGWLAARGMTVPDESNRAAATNPLLLARLSLSEALLLAVGDGGGAMLDEFEQALARERPAGCYGVPRQDMSAWFRLEGDRWAPAMAELCAVDLRPARFAEGAVAQTSVAHQNAILIRRDRDGPLGFDLLTDFAGAAYLWDVLARRIAPDQGVSDEV